ncbi:MAG: maleylacetate reductase [Solirubrobacteraceae bacterium]
MGRGTSALVADMTAETSFVYDALPGRVVFGCGAGRSRLASELERAGAERVLLIAAAAERELAQRLVAPLGGRVVDLFDDVRPHVPVAIAERARGSARAAGADWLLSVGGGSTTGTAKAVALELGLPIAAVPTTYAGSEMTPVWGLTEAGRKTTGRSAAVLPRLVVYDPELTVSLPPSITGPSAVNALAHCIEAFYAPGTSPIAALLAEEGIRGLAKGTPAAVARPDDLGARSAALYGAYLAGAAFALAGSDLHHKICHVLGGALDAPHAETHTVLLPHVVGHLEPALAQPMARIGAALGVPESGGSVAPALYDFVAGIGAPTALRELGLDLGDLHGVVPEILAQVPPTTPRSPTAEDLRALLTAAWEGERPNSTDLPPANKERGWTSSSSPPPAIV